MLRKKIAIVEDDRLLRQQIGLALTGDYQVVEAGERAQAENLLEQERPEVALVDLNLPPGGRMQEGLALIEKVRRDLPDTIVIAMSGNTDRAATLKAVQAGAYDFFRKPFDFAELKLIIRRALEKQEVEQENERLRQELRAMYSFSNIIGQTPAMLKLFDAVRRVANSATTVIIRGESGTGKELIARAIHYNSRRSKEPFVSVNCAALPETLVESELFGHERGAFTGAIAARPGRFELAGGGTLFLDEIGAISPQVQAKLLRVLEERRFERIGGTRQIRAEARLITATNEDLEGRVKQGAFREDLYYRIHVFPIQVPPLRERSEDIPLLLDHFLRTYCRQNELAPKKPAPAVIDLLARYRWPGNVRELENLVQTLVLMADHETIQPDHLPAYIINGLPRQTDAPAPHPPPGPPITDDDDDDDSATVDLDQATESYQRQLLLRAIEKSGGIKNRAARLLSIDTNRMKYLCRKYGL